MAMGQQKDRQGDLMVSWSEMPRSPGHVFYDRLQSVLVEADFDGFAEALCKPYYAARMGAPSVPPGRYFRMHLVGYFEGIGSERGLSWRCSDWSCLCLVERRWLSFGHNGLECDRRLIAERGVASGWIVEAVDVTANGVFGVLSGLESGPPDEF